MGLLLILFVFFLGAVSALGALFYLVAFALGKIEQETATDLANARTKIGNASIEEMMQKKKERDEKTTPTTTPTNVPQDLHKRSELVSDNYLILSYRIQIRRKENRGNDNIMYYLYVVPTYSAGHR